MCENFNEKGGTQASSPTAHCSKGCVGCEDEESVNWLDMVEVEEYKKKKSFDNVRDVSYYIRFPFPLCLNSDPRIT
jgi:hypothetical protein